MNTTPEMRSLEFLVDGQWTPGKWPDLKAGTIFRMYEPDGELHTDNVNSVSTFIATSDATPEPAPTYYGVVCDPLVMGIIPAPPKNE